MPAPVKPPPEAEKLGRSALQDDQYYYYGDEGEEDGFYGDEDGYDYYYDEDGGDENFMDYYYDEEDDEYWDEMDYGPEDYEQLHPSHQSSFFKPDSPIARFIEERNQAYEEEQHKSHQEELKEKKPRTFKNPYYKLLGWEQPAPIVHQIQYLPVPEKPVKPRIKTQT